MYPLVASFAVLSTVGLILLARAVMSAPEGYEDERGFHTLNAQDAPEKVSEAGFGAESLLFLEQHMASQPWR